MASPQSIARLVASRRPALAVPSTTLRLLAAANFSSSVPLAATPAGPPPSGFRLPRPKRWDESDESSVDKASKYFLMSELFRGMYVVLEQFFRPP
jgi:NADH dehydrogenase (ubiquinone) Fe-S protein 8